MNGWLLPDYIVKTARCLCVYRSIHPPTSHVCLTISFSGLWVPPPPFSALKSWPHSQLLSISLMPLPLWALWWGPTQQDLTWRPLPHPWDTCSKTSVPRAGTLMMWWERPHICTPNTQPELCSQDWLEGEGRHALAHSCTRLSGCTSPFPARLVRKNRALAFCMASFLPSYQKKKSINLPCWESKKRQWEGINKAFTRFHTQTFPSATKVLRGEALG